MLQYDLKIQKYMWKKTNLSSDGQNNKPNYNIVLRPNSSLQQSTNHYSWTEKGAMNRDLWNTELAEAAALSTFY